MTTLYQEGPRDAKIMFVGESPGATEVQRGRPFIGGSGELLDRMLSNAGISRHECFLTNVCHVQPPKNEFSWFERSTNQIHLVQGLVRLRHDILTTRPNLVVALGSKPLEYLTGKKGIDKWRGSVLPSVLAPGAKVLGTYHPAFILRSYDYKAVAEMDFRRALEESTTPDITYPDRTIYLPDGEWRRRSAPNATDWEWIDAAHNLDDLASRILASPDFSVDIECYLTPSGWKLACVGFSPDPSWALVLPTTEPHFLRLIRLLCESHVPKVLQNGAFDFTVLRDSGIAIRSFWWDTMLAHHTLYAECAGGADEVSAMTNKPRHAAIRKGLGFLTSINTREPFYKNDGKAWRDLGDLRIFYRYNGLDCCVTQESRLVQEKELTDAGLFPAFRATMDLCEPLMWGTHVGLRVDVARRNELRQGVEEKVRKQQSELDTVAGTPVNVSSNKQVTHFLYDTLHLPPRRNRESGALRADSDALIELASKHPSPALQLILDIRENRTLLERYLDTPLDHDQRMRCSWDITGTRSYRLSSRASLSGSGTNLQNQPEFIREVYCADPGCVFVNGDLSQAEARLVALLARDAWLIELFADPARDIHKETAAAIFGVNVADVSPDQRQLGKKCRHAVNYGMNAKRFVEVVNSDSATTGITIDQRAAQRVIDGFFSLHPNHKSVYWRGVEDELRYSRTLKNPFGYQRTFFGRWDDNLLRDGYSWIPQSTVGVLGRLAWVRADAVVRPLGGEVLLNVHDSIMVQCPRDATSEVAIALRSAMDIPFSVSGYPCRIPVDIAVGENWGKRGKDGSNPKGLVPWEG